MPAIVPTHIPNPISPARPRTNLFSYPLTVPAAPRRKTVEPSPEDYQALVRDYEFARDYERRTELFPGWREQLVGRLRLRRADTVLDIGCGSGLNFPALHARVGPHGRIIGIDDSPRLLALARSEAQRRGWNNITLIDTSALAELPRTDAALMCAAHDILQSRTTLTALLGSLRHNSTIAAGGWKWPSRMLWPLRAVVTARQRPWVADFSGFDQPWRLLADHVPNLRITEIGIGTGYLAHAQIAPSPARSAPADRPVRLNSHAHRDPQGRFEWFQGHVSTVLDPLARRCAGLPVTTVRPLLARAWRHEFSSQLGEPALTDCATALSCGDTGLDTLWTDFATDPGPQLPPPRSDDRRREHHRRTDHR